MHFFAGPDTGHDGFDLLVADQRVRNISNFSSRYARNVGLAATRLFKSGEDSVDGLFQAQKKARHISGSDGERASAADLLVEKWDH